MATCTNHHITPAGTLFTCAARVAAATAGQRFPQKQLCGLWLWQHKACLQVRCRVGSQQFVHTACGGRWGQFRGTGPRKGNQVVCNSLHMQAWDFMLKRAHDGGITFWRGRAVEHCQWCIHHTGVLHKHTNLFNNFDMAAMSIAGSNRICVILSSTRWLQV